jgi:hypothetical protein
MGTLDAPNCARFGSIAWPRKLRGLLWVPLALRAYRDPDTGQWVGGSPPLLPPLHLDGLIPNNSLMGAILGVYNQALDQMQGRGVPPSAVEDAIVNGQAAPGNKPGTVVHTGTNGVRVVTGTDGSVVTVITIARP